MEKSYFTIIKWTHIDTKTFYTFSFLFLHLFITCSTLRWVPLIGLFYVECVSIYYCPAKMMTWVSFVGNRGLRFGSYRYVNNPLLLEGRKFDVRSYLLIACTDPYIVFFRHGYARLTCDPYDPRSNNLTAHLTNQVKPSWRPLPLKGLWRVVRSVSRTNWNHWEMFSGNLT